MKVVIVAPFRSPIAFRMGISPENDESYSDWMKRLSQSVKPEDVEAFRWEHDPLRKGQGPGFYYNDLASDSSPYPAEWGVAYLCKPELAQETKGESGDWPALEFKADRVRLYGRGLGIYEAEFHLKGEVLSPSDPGESAKALSERLREDWCRRRLEEVFSRVLVPLREQLAAANEEGLLLDEADEEAPPAVADGRVMYWASIGLVCESIDLENLPVAGDGASRPQPRLKEASKALLAQWLHHVAPAEEEIKKLDTPNGYSLKWLNYAFREDSPLDGIGERPGENMMWEGLCYAQYAYTVMESLSRRTSRLLHSVYRQKIDARIRKSLKRLERMMRSAQLFMLSLEERRRYLNREKEARVDEILKAWDFRDLTKELDEHLEQARESLERAHNQALERSTVLTDILLAVLAVLSLFDIAANIAVLSRQLQADAMLGTQSEDYLGVANVLATKSFDSVMLACIGFAGIFIAAYCILRRRLIV